MAEVEEDRVLPPCWRRVLALVRRLETELGVEETEDDKLPRGEA